jgi:HK97 family phage prohead protease
MDLITRNTTEHQTQIVERDGKKEISGYGAIYYDGTPSSEYHLGDNLYERIQPGAFDRPLAERENVEIRYNHSDDFILGDVEGGAVVKVDDKGLRYSLPYDAADPQHQTVLAKINKGLIRGSSIGMYGPQYRFTQENGKDIAWVTGVKKIRDVGPVGRPAYTGATATIRSADCDEQYQAWLKRKAETEKRLAKLAKMNAQ